MIHIAKNIVTVTLKNHRLYSRLSEKGNNGFEIWISSELTLNVLNTFMKYGF